MSDDDEFDPNKDVPIWVNIVVPIVSALIFIGVLIILFHTKKEVPLETIEDWIDRIPLVNRCISTDYDTTETDAIAKRTSSSRGASVKGSQRNSKITQINERSKIRKTLSYSDIRRYDSISTIRTQDNTTASSDLQGSSKKQYFYASQGTLMSFESSV
ncbi:uncharacterized protein LOC132748499 [Ruditapes philippinarum]|uniref:uncharacterized protein LOC132748499 n=1 Tax=Ruditapes philippinarum TaxID=129788 RepID=UPI00295A913B|nr:uncharacterized protein LOC132748499 [Ruditapes philippinarum]XP_060594125.1 uncharacterized protein LOC132748499 [Ruditapes philippinarum]